MNVNLLSVGNFYVQFLKHLALHARKCLSECWKTENPLYTISQRSPVDSYVYLMTVSTAETMQHQPREWEDDNKNKSIQGTGMWQL
jgi:hypothetical protein